jgi:hypothetical protein
MRCRFLHGLHGFEGILYNILILLTYLPFLLDGGPELGYIAR